MHNFKTKRIQQWNVESFEIHPCESYPSFPKQTHDELACVTLVHPNSTLVLRRLKRRRVTVQAPVVRDDEQITRPWRGWDADNVLCTWEMADVKIRKKLWDKLDNSFSHRFRRVITDYFDCEKGTWELPTALDYWCHGKGDQRVLTCFSQVVEYTLLF